MYCFCLEVGAKPLTKRLGFVIIAEYLGVAQFGRVLGSGPRGRRFKSSHSDHKKTENVLVLCFFIICTDVEPAVDWARTRDQGGTSKKRFGESFFVPRAPSSKEHRKSAKAAARCDYANGEGRERFKSSHSDHKNQGVVVTPWFLLFERRHRTFGRCVPKTGARGNKEKMIRGIIFYAVSTAEQGESEICESR